MMQLVQLYVLTLSLSSLSTCTQTLWSHLPNVWNFSYYKLPVDVFMLRYCSAIILTQKTLCKVGCKVRFAGKNPTIKKRLIIQIDIKKFVISTWGNIPCFKNQTSWTAEIDEVDCVLKKKKMWLGEEKQALYCYSGHPVRQSVVRTLHCSDGDPA